MDNYKILIVDDQLIGRQLLESVLFQEDYELFFAEDGQEALDKIHEHQPDVVLLDVMMPQIDGFEVCRRVRSDSKIKDTPIILVTALDDRDSRLNGYEAGANDYISKPIDRLELLARVKNLTQLFRYKIKSESTPGQQEVTKVVETPQEFLTQIKQFLNQQEKDNLNRFFPDFFELTNNSESELHSGAFALNHNGSINLLYFQCGHEQFCNEASILINNLFPKAVQNISIVDLKKVFNDLIEKLDEYFQNRFQQLISDKISLIWLNINRVYHTFKFVSLNIETRMLSENGDGYLIKKTSEENTFKSIDKILLFSQSATNSVENIQENNFPDLDSFIEHLTNREQEIMLAGFTLG